MNQSVFITDKNGETHVWLSADGDHIVVRFIAAKGREYEAPVAADTIPWSRAVERANRAAVFL